MSSRAAGTVWSSFETEVSAAFAADAAALGVVARLQPEIVGGVRCVVLDADGARVGAEVCLVLQENAVETDVWLRTPDAVLKAGLAGLVVASGLGARQHVSRGVTTLYSLRKALASQADWLLRVHPLLSGPDGPALMRRAAGDG